MRDVDMDIMDPFLMGTLNSLHLSTCSTRSPRGSGQSRMFILAPCSDNTLDISSDDSAALLSEEDCEMSLSSPCSLLKHDMDPTRYPVSYNPSTRCGVHLSQTLGPAPWVCASYARQLAFTDCHSASNATNRLLVRVQHTAAPTYYMGRQDVLCRASVLKSGLDNEAQADNSPASLWLRLNNFLVDMFVHV